MKYTIQFKSTTQHANADALSRLPLQSQIRGEESEAEHVSCFNVSQTGYLPLTAKQLQAATRKDPLLSRVFNFVKNGWPERCTDVNLQPY